MSEMLISLMPATSSLVWRPGISKTDCGRNECFLKVKTREVNSRLVSRSNRRLIEVETNPRRQHCLTRPRGSIWFSRGVCVRRRYIQIE